MRIEVLWFQGCPNHLAADSLLRSVLQDMGVQATVESIEVPDEETARRLVFPGSPTIRVNGADVEPGWQPCEDCTPRCRVYWTASGLKGVPEAAWIEAAIARALAGRA